MRNNDFFDFDDDINFNFDKDFEIPEKSIEIKKNNNISKKFEKSKSIFDHIKAITQEPYDPDYFDNLSDNSKKTFLIYMINRFISMNPDWTQLVNRFQYYSQFVSSKEAYKYYSLLIPKEVKFYKYIKAKKESKNNKKLVELISSYYEVSKKEASEYLDIFYKISNGLDKLKQICYSYGYDEKETKKLIARKE